ncbi:hypothetical protein [Rhizobium rhizogenes]|uniref:hypothetical protein n=1 Tax=Rhizobium rhizogenes TaxID=359 RepID=UPI00226EEC79|nr:hypothetical protein [Rhizobium rhizogenes]
MTTSANTVIVACKLPAGIYMQGYEMRETQEQTPLGFRAVKTAVPFGPKVKINGNAAAQGSVAPGLVEGGYVLTHNVPADTAKAWLEANKESDMVKNKLILVHEKQEALVSQSRNNHAILSGLERLDVGTVSKAGREVPADPRWPRSNNANVSAIKSDSRAA